MIISKHISKSVGILAERNVRKGRRRLWFLLALAIDMMSIMSLLCVWSNLYVVYSLAVIIGLFFGFSTEGIEDMVVLLFAAYVLGGIGSVLMVASPSIVTGAPWWLIQIGMLTTVGTIIFSSFIIFPLSFMSSLIGLVVSDRFFKGSKIPEFALK
jgi:hypothetical protein